MSSEKTEKNPAKKVKSITNQLYFNLLREKLWMFFQEDILIFILVSLGWIIHQELMEFGKIIFHYNRQITTENGILGLTYLVNDSQGTQLLSIVFGPKLVVFLIIWAIVIILQLLGIAFHYGKDYRRIRQTLQPLDEMALKAEEISRMVFDENKYQQIEDAITNLTPEDMGALSFGDKDLAGIETAMNNLLIRIRDSYQQQARFVNDASHELRTPIAVIEGYANMLSRWGKEDQAILDESIQAIQKESSHMKYLVEQLLFLARGDSGKTKLDYKEISLVGMMKDIYEESIMIDENHIYKFKCPDYDILFQADETLLKQAVRILVDNAAKYTNEKDEIYLEVGKNDGHPYLQVQDVGIGMANADIVHMFERFYRADESRSYEGTGLGLSIAKWIIDKHHGHFEVTSRTELGTRIRIIL